MSLSKLVVFDRPLVGATAAEPNDQRGQASPLAPPAAHAQAALGTASDVDWYKVSAPFPSALSAYVQGPVAPRATLRAYRQLLRWRLRTLNI